MPRINHRASFRVLIPLTALMLTPLLLTGCEREPAVARPDQVAHAATLVSDRPPLLQPPSALSSRPGSRPSPADEVHSSIRFRDVSDSTGIRFTHNSGNSPE